MTRNPDDMAVLTDLQSMYLNILGARDEYERRVYDPDHDDDENENLEPHAADNEDNNEGESKPVDVKVSSRPQLIDRDIDFQRENFHNLKLAYLEQETKEKFVRAVVSDPPLVVEQADIAALESENAAKKHRLQDQKRVCAELQTELEAQSRAVCAEWDELAGQGKTEESARLVEEMRAMEAELAQLEAQHEALRVPDTAENESLDADLLLPLDGMRSLAADYDSRARTLREARLSELDAAVSQRQADLARETQAVAELEAEHARVQQAARETVELRERELRRGLEEREATARWYNHMLALFEAVAGVAAFTVLERNSDSGVDRFGFELQGARFQVSLASSQSPCLLSAQVTDPRGRVTPEQCEQVLQELVAGAGELGGGGSGGCGPGAFLGRMAYLLAEPEEEQEREQEQERDIDMDEDQQQGQEHETRQQQEQQQDQEREQEQEQEQKQDQDIDMEISQDQAQAQDQSPIQNDDQSQVQNNEQSPDHMEDQGQAQGNEPPDQAQTQQPN